MFPSGVAQDRAKQGTKTRKNVRTENQGENVEGDDRRQRYGDISIKIVPSKGAARYAMGLHHILAEWAEKLAKKEIDLLHFRASLRP